jgi:hypothetical protein
MDQAGHKGFPAPRCPLDHHRGQIRRRCRHPLGQFLRRLAGAHQGGGFWHRANVALQLLNPQFLPGDALGKGGQIQGQQLIQGV